MLAEVVELAKLVGIAGIAGIAGALTRAARRQLRDRRIGPGESRPPTADVREDADDGPMR